MKVLIVGAGPTGLTAALELVRNGIKPTLIERRTKPSQLSRAVGILPNSMRLLAPSGVSELIQRHGIQATELHLYQGDQRRAWIHLDTLTEDIQRIYCLPQNRTENFLQQRLEYFGGRVRRGIELQSLHRSTDGNLVGFSDNTQQRYDVVVGADGVQSRVRRAIGARYEGIDLTDAWSIADVELPNWRHPGAFTIFLCDNAQVVMIIPLSVERYRIVSNTTDALAAMPIDIQPTRIRRQATFTIAVRQVDHYRYGQVFLAGDAAHCHSPVGGRGMNLGIADGADLARRLVEGNSDGYHDSRHAAGAATIALSERARKALTGNSNLPRSMLIKTLLLARHLPFLERTVVARFMGE